MQTLCSKSMEFPLPAVPVVVARVVVARVAVAPVHLVVLLVPAPLVHLLFLVRVLRVAVVPFPHLLASLVAQVLVLRLSARLVQAVALLAVVVHHLFHQALLAVPLSLLRAVQVIVPQVRAVSRHHLRARLFPVVLLAVLLVVAAQALVLLLQVHPHIAAVRVVLLPL